MTVHTRAVVAVERLRHEGRAFTLFRSHVAHCVLKDLQVIGGAQQSRITEINFTLAGGSNFMVMAFDMNAGFLQLVRNLAAKILKRVERRQRHIAFLVANVISEIRVAVLTIGIPDGFRRIDGKSGTVSLILKTHIVEDEELSLR